MQAGTAPQVQGQACGVNEYNDTRRCSESGLPARLIDGCAGGYATRLGVEAGELRSGKSACFVEALQRGRWLRCSPGWLCGAPARRSFCPGALGKWRRWRHRGWTSVLTVPRPALPGIPGNSLLWSINRYRQWKGTGGMALPDPPVRDGRLRLYLIFQCCVYKIFPSEGECHTRVAECIWVPWPGQIRPDSGSDLLYCSIWPIYGTCRTEITPPDCTTTATVSDSGRRVEGSE